jgi:hypothetical protein
MTPIGKRFDKDHYANQSHAAVKPEIFAGNYAVG